eukprot:CAMPEP_0202831806 /NCGR_PEP_ID=MMETSP1389-20130828/17068_1 /ASSEMBLY_ACC=CAM_ASM_000865 /TAXON_ID=302021 /ORGANISM="Rhodomonas sp., Strain CCMP768" /LENGTH=301 /DNA_ID=CAMNT_0049505577 /DNA_START=12 /DNA_END=917 /DNA_ORIENTATION=+
MTAVDGLLVGRVDLKHTAGALDDLLLPTSSASTRRLSSPGRCSRSSLDVGVEREAERARSFWNFVGRRKESLLSNSRTRSASADKTINSEELTIASVRGKLQDVQKLLKGRKKIAGKEDVCADPNSKNSEGFSALFLAVQHGRVDVVRALVEAGASPNMKCGPDGVTPLCLAAAEGKTAELMVMAGSGASVDVPQEGGVTPLYVAASNGHAIIVRELLLRNVNVHRRTEKDDTAVEAASRRGHVAVVKMLEASGAVCKEAREGEQEGREKGFVLPAFAGKTREALVLALQREGSLSLQSEN